MSRTRSEQMSRIRGSGTKPETLLHDALLAHGVECTPNARDVLGRPDLVIRPWRLAVFVDGCFWHGCPDHYVRPRGRADFWAERLRSNVDRDCRQTAELERAGWQVLRLWEHDVVATTEAVAASIAHRHRLEDAADWRVRTVVVLDPTTDLEEQQLVRLRDPNVTMVRRRLRSTRAWPIAEQESGSSPET